MNLSITLTAAVVLQNRVRGSYGIAEVIDLACISTPVGSNIAALGGVGYRVKKGSGSLSNADTAAGTATFTASGKAESVSIAAFGLHAPEKELAVAGFTIVAPSSLKFVKASNVFHTNGKADAGVRCDVMLQPPGVSYERLLLREGSFKGKGIGYYASLNGLVHPANAVGFTAVNGNHCSDTVYSGFQLPPWKAGKFEWNIPWQYQLPGTNDWITFTFANHVQEINAAGVVSIGKFNAGLFSAKPSDPDQGF